MGVINCKHKRLYIFMVILCTIVVVYGILIISHYVEKDRISKRTGITLNMNPDDSEYKEYNVDGMTDEEIDKYLDIIRSGENVVDE